MRRSAMAAACRHGGGATALMRVVVAGQPLRRGWGSQNCRRARMGRWSERVWGRTSDEAIVTGGVTRMWSVGYWAGWAAAGAERRCVARRWPQPAVRGEARPH